MATKKKKTRSKKQKTISVLGFAVTLNAFIQILEPYVTAGIIPAAKAKDAAAFLAAVKAGTHDSVTIQNLLEALGPVGALGVARAIAKMFNVKDRKLGMMKLGIRGD